MTAAPHVLLTGASGYLGQHVLQSLLVQGCRVTVLGTSAPAGFDNLPFIRANLLDAAATASAVQAALATHLMHLAWYAEYGKFWASPLNYRWVDASVRLTEAFCAAGGQHVVMAGSCAEYDWANADAQPLLEDTTPYRPHTVYGVAKDATRRLCTALCAQHGVTLAWGHIFFPFGPGEARQRMIPSLIDVFQGNAPPFGVNASAQRGMLYVADAADAFAKLLTTQANGNFNICSGQGDLVEDVVRELARLYGADPQPVLKLASSRAGDPALLVGDNQRLRATGWAPRYTLVQGLAATVQAHSAPTRSTPIQSPEGINV
jgi:nucleoside-diphosphate-sugar epimerase